MKMGNGWVDDEVDFSDVPFPNYNVMQVTEEKKKAQQRILLHVYISMINSSRDVLLT